MEMSGPAPGSPPSPGKPPCQPASAQFLPWRSCRSLAPRGCPGLPSLPSPGGRRDGLSGPGHSFHRCSEGGNGKDRGTWVTEGQEEPAGDALSEPRAGHPAHQCSALTLFLPSHIPAAALLCPQGTRSQQLALSFLQEEAQVRPSQSAFQTGVWEEAEGPAEGPSVLAVPATCTRSEDNPQGSRMK